MLALLHRLGAHWASAATTARCIGGTVVALCLGSLVMTPTFAQEPPSAALCATLPEKRQAARPSVKSASRYQAANATTPKDEVQLGDDIIVEFNNLDTLLLERACDPASPATKKIVLFLDDRPLIDVEAYPPQYPTSDRMIFPLRRTEQSREAWAHVLGRPPWNPRAVKVSVGLQDRFSIDSGTTLDFVVLPHWWFGSGVAFIVILVGSLFFIKGWSHVLRDTDSRVSGASKPWSLARVQAAWWFFLILASYLMIGLVTGDYSDSLTGTVLVLLGIASGTTAVSAFIDRSRDTPALAAAEQAAITQLKQDINQIKADLVSPPAPPTKTPEQLEAEKAAKESQLRKLNRESEDFFTDILSDANGTSLHRFQAVGWTLVLGIVFVVKVYQELAMPQFSETLLGLMGLSAGTYAAMKSTEANVPKT